MVKTKTVRMKIDTVRRLKLLNPNAPIDSIISGLLHCIEVNDPIIKGAISNGMSRLLMGEVLGTELPNDNVPKDFEVEPDDFEPEPCIAVPAFLQHKSDAPCVD